MGQITHTQKIGHSLQFLIQNEQLSFYQSRARNLSINIDRCWTCRRMPCSVKFLHLPIAMKHRNAIPQRFSINSCGELIFP